MDDNKQMHIAFICDENYVMPTVVAITSLYINKDSFSRYFIHILASDISEKSALIFKNMKHHDFDIEVVDVSQSEEFKECKIKDLHVSTAALYKFNIAKIFPEYDKMLYLDGDILIQKDLRTLFDTDISHVYAAVVKDYKPMTYKPPQVKKLGINHSSYFNSGVMLLNLKKFREDNLAEKLFDYRLNGINYFMDQDALNVVFEEKVTYLSYFYNVMSSVMGAFKLDTLKKYYELGSVKTKEDIYNKATIIHLCTKYKPWDYSDVPFADEWLFYYGNTPFLEPLERKKLDKETRQKIFAELGYQLTPRDFGIEKEVIISFTSFPERIKYVDVVLDSLIQQTVKVDRILLWLADSQFPNREKDLSEKLLDKIKGNVEIRWCEDIKSHKKYYYAMKEYPNALIITVDDDLYYKDILVETLLNSYIHYPYAISAMRAHQITLDENKKIAPYAKWKREYSIVGNPSLALLATGIGGVLYPPHIMHQEIFNIEKIKELCLYADDLWLKIMQVMTNTPVVVAAKPQKFINIDGTQDTALWKVNDIHDANDKQFQNLIGYYDTFISDKDTLENRLIFAVENINLGFNKIQEELVYKEKQLNDMEKRLNLQTTKAENYKKHLSNVQNSKSYKLGRAITFVPRKIRGGIHCYNDHGATYTVKRMLEHFGIPMGIKLKK